MLATVEVLCNKAGAEESRPSREGDSGMGHLSSNRHTLGANVDETEERVEESERRQWRVGRGAGGAFREVLAAVRRLGH